MSRIPFLPHWYAAAMGTGIFTIALPGLPFAVPGASDLALAFWLLATAMLVAQTGVLVAHLRRDPAVLARHFDDPAIAPFYGAAAMALLVVGAGAVSGAERLLGSHLALGLDVSLWIVGTILGLTTALAVPFRVITRHVVADDSATGGWLMPVVPPLVSATTGALLVPHLPAGQPQESLLLCCYALLGLSVIAGFLILNQLWHRLIRHGVPAPAAVPTVWIVLGFLGQSVTAAHHLGALAPTVVPEYGGALHAFALCYGLPVWGFTLLWLALALLLTVRQARLGLPFAPSWWAFTFPLGNVVTATSALAAMTGLDMFTALTALAAVLLLAGWGLAVVGTVRALAIRVRTLPATPVVSA